MLGLMLVGTPLAYPIEKKFFGGSIEVSQILLAWWFWWGVKTWAFECWRFPKHLSALERVEEALKALRPSVHRSDCPAFRLDEVEGALKLHLYWREQHEEIRRKSNDEDIEWIRDLNRSWPRIRFSRIIYEFMVEENLAVVRGDRGITEARSRLYEVKRLLNEVVPFPRARQHCPTDNGHCGGVEEKMGEILARLWIEAKNGNRKAKLEDVQHILIEG